MVRSLVVLLIPLVLISLFFMSRPTEPAGTDPVDWQPMQAVAAEEASFDVVAPRNLPADWIPIRMKWEPGVDGRDQRWMLGWLSPQEIYFAVEQSNVDAQLVIKRVTRDGVVDGASQVAGKSWHRYRSPDDRTRSLVLTEGDLTTIVMADSSYEALEAFASTLA